MLEEIKNFHNVSSSDRPVSRTSFDFNYQDYSGGKPPGNTMSQNNPTLFKKQNQNSSKPISPSPTLTSNNPSNK